MKSALGHSRDGGEKAECPQCGSTLEFAWVGEMRDKYYVCLHCTYKRDIPDTLVVAKRELSADGSKEVTTVIARHDGPEVLVKEVMDQLGGQTRQRTFLKSGDSRKEVTLPEFMDEVMNRFEVSPELHAAVRAKNYKDVGEFISAEGLDVPWRAPEAKREEKVTISRVMYAVVHPGKSDEVGGEGEWHWPNYVVLALLLGVVVLFLKTC